MTWLPPGMPKEAYERMDRLDRFRKSVYAKAAAEIVSKLDEVDASAVVDDMEYMECSFTLYKWDSESVEAAAQAKRDLLTLSKKADELANLVKALGLGAVAVMKRRTVRPDLYQDAEPELLPENHPGYTPQSDEEAEEWMAGGRWVIRLRALAELAKVKAERIARQTAKGGRISFSTRLGQEPPEEWLARACKEYVEARGCHSQAVILKMVQAIQAVFQGEKGKKPSAGRAFVRKVVQTQVKTGSI